MGFPSRDQSRLHLCAHSSLTIGEALKCNYGRDRLKQPFISYSDKVMFRCHSLNAVYYIIDLLNTITDHAYVIISQQDQIYSAGE